MDKSIIKKLSNIKQLISAYDFEVIDGQARGKRMILVNNNRLEVCFNADNGLDIAWVKFAGVNVSFLSKNGFNTNEGVFGERFEGGFLYTCGLDNVSACVKDVAIHGSLHLRKAQNVNYFTDDDKVIVTGELCTTKLFGKDLWIKRKYTVTANNITIDDTIINKGYVDCDYVLLYHINFGYPFLDEGLNFEINNVKTIAANTTPQENINTCKDFTAPKDTGLEDLFYHYLSEGKAVLQNNNVNIKCTMTYDIEKLPILVQWKNLYSGDYVLGVEPATTRFDEFKMNTLKPDQSENFTVNIKFENI